MAIEKVGYGQVEPNHLSAQRTGQIYAQTPVAADTELVENGMFFKRDSAKGELNGEGNGEWMLVYNEIKLYDGARQGYKDFAVKAGETLHARIYPRMFKVNIGDIYTTNMAPDGALGDVLVPSVDGLIEDDSLTKMKFEIVKVTTMADGQKAVKVMRVA